MESSYLPKPPLERSNSQRYDSEEQQRQGVLPAHETRIKVTETWTDEGKTQISALVGRVVLRPKTYIISHTKAVQVKIHAISPASNAVMECYL